MKKEAQIYVHIPFCVKKCDYCDFLSAPAPKEAQADYVRHLINDIQISGWATEGLSVPTIFIGGGTPSILEEQQIVGILEAIRGSYEVLKDAEITIEVNPGTVTREKLVAYKNVGINRLSFGLQSSNERELKLLGRIHTYEEFLESYQLAREIGFTNINVDLMSALPGQSLRTYQETVKKVCDLEPEHISAYSLMIEENTPFAGRYMEDEEKRRKGEKPELLPSEEEERAMYDWTKEYLDSRGYHRYEISNYAKLGFECKHNVGYWKRVDYLGFGLGAASLHNDIRYFNEPDFPCYMQDMGYTDAKLLSEEEKMEEFMFLGLRMDEGVSAEEFEKEFQRTLEAVYGPVLTKLREQDLVEFDGNICKLTELGRAVSNMVLSEFLLGE